MLTSRGLIHSQNFDFSAFWISIADPCGRWQCNYKFMRVFLDENKQVEVIWGELHIYSITQIIWSNGRIHFIALIHSEFYMVNNYICKLIADNFDTFWFGRDQGECSLVPSLLKLRRSPWNSSDARGGRVSRRRTVSKRKEMKVGYQHLPSGYRKPLPYLKKRLKPLDCVEMTS